MQRERPLENAAASTASLGTVRGRCGADGRETPDTNWASNPRACAMRPEPQDDRLLQLADALVQRPYARRGIAASSEPIRVLLVDDHALFRAGLRLLLHAIPDVQIVGDCDATTDIARQVARLGPDVVVLDLNMPGQDGLAITRVLSALERAPRVLILSMHSEEEFLLPALEAGASGFLTKEAVESELIEALRVVAAGDTYVRPRVARLLAARERERALQRRQPRSAAGDGLAALSTRERTVVELTARGFGGVEIGQQLGISNKTVETYKERIEEKLGIRHRTEYVRFALDIGLLHR